MNTRGDPNGEYEWVKVQDRMVRSIEELSSHNSKQGGKRWI